jgi:hypothetical protein
MVFQRNSFQNNAFQVFPAYTSIETIRSTVRDGELARTTTRDKESASVTDRG